MKIMENKIKEDFQLAALKLYPEEWKEFDNGFKVDHNASKRDIAEEAFKYVFDTLRFDEDLLVGVVSAFLRRKGDYAPATICDKRIYAAYMGTALEYAIIKIRDGD